MVIITVKYEAIDGAFGQGEFTSLDAARFYAQRRVGRHPEIGHGYAVSDDGIVKITVQGASLRDLFPPHS